MYNMSLVHLRIKPGQTCQYMHTGNPTKPLNRLYGVWHLWLFTWYFRFQNKCNRNKFAAVSRWMSGFYIKQIYKECHWTPFYPPITLRGREYYFPVVRMFLRAFSPKQLAETSVHRATHPTVTKMTIVKLCFNVLLHIFTKQFENEYSLWESNSNCKIDDTCPFNTYLIFYKIRQYVILNMYE